MARRWTAGSIDFHFLRTKRLLRHRRDGFISFSGTHLLIIYYFESMMNIRTTPFIYLASAIAMPASGILTHPLPHPTKNQTTSIENPPAVAPDGNPPQTMLRRGDRRSLAIASEDEHHPDESYLLVRPHLTVDCCIVHAIHLIL